MQTVVRGELEGGKRVVVGWMKGGVADDSWFDGNCLVSRADRKYYRSGWGSGAGCWVSDDVGEEESWGDGERVVSYKYSDGVVASAAALRLVRTARRYGAGTGQRTRWRCSVGEIARGCQCAQPV